MVKNDVKLHKVKMCQSHSFNLHYYNFLLENIIVFGLLFNPLPNLNEPIGSHTRYWNQSQRDQNCVFGMVRMKEESQT